MAASAGIAELPPCPAGWPDVDAAARRQNYSQAAKKRKQLRNRLTILMSQMYWRAAVDLFRCRVVCKKPVDVEDYNELLQAIVAVDWFALAMTAGVQASRLKMTAEYFERQSASVIYACVERCLGAVPADWGAPARGGAATGASAPKRARTSGSASTGVTESLDATTSSAAASEDAGADGAAIGSKRPRSAAEDFRDEQERMRVAKSKASAWAKQLVAAVESEQPPAPITEPSYPGPEAEQAKELAASGSRARASWQAAVQWVYRCAAVLDIQLNAKSHLLLAHAALQVGDGAAARGAVQDGLKSGALRAGRLWEVAQPVFLLRLARAGAVEWAEVPGLPSAAAAAVAKERSWLFAGGRAMGGGMLADGAARALGTGREGEREGEGAAAPAALASHSGAGAEAAATGPPAPASLQGSEDCYKHQVAVDAAELQALSQGAPSGVTGSVPPAADGAAAAASTGSAAHQPPSSASAPSSSSSWCPPDPGSATSAPPDLMGLTSLKGEAASAPRFASSAPGWLSSMRGAPPPGSIESVLLPRDADDKACLVAAAAAASAGDQRGSKHGAVLRVAPRKYKAAGVEGGGEGTAASSSSSSSSLEPSSSSSASGGSGPGSDPAPAPLATPLACCSVGFNHRFNPFPRAMRRLWRSLGIGSKLAPGLGGDYDVGDEFAGGPVGQQDEEGGKSGADGDAEQEDKTGGQPRGAGKEAPAVNFGKILRRGAPYQRWAVPGVLPEGESYRWKRGLPFQKEDMGMLRMGNNSKIMHAEIHCISQLKDIEDARGAEMMICELDQLGIGYDTAIPCRMCTRALNQIGIGRIVYTSHSGLVEMTTRYNPSIMCETLAMARG